MRPHYTIGVVNESIQTLVNVTGINGEKPGFAVEIARLVCQRLSYQCAFVVANLSYGDCINGSCTGMLGAIAQGLYNTSLPIFSDNNYRLGQFDFGYTAIRRPIQFAIRRPGAKPPPFLKVFLMPFSGQIWATILAVIILISSLIMVSKSLIIGHSRPNWLEYTLTTAVNISSYLVRKGPALGRLTTSSKLILSTWGVATLFLGASYTGGLQPSMFKVDRRLPFTDLTSLLVCLRAKKCRMVVNPNDRWFLEIIKVPSLKYNQFESVLVDNPAVMVGSELESYNLIVSQPDIYMVTPPGSIDKLLETVDKEDCAINIITTHYDYSFFPILAKAKVDRKLIDRQLQFLEESGLSAQLISKYKSYADCNEKLNVGTTTTAPIPLRMALGSLVLLSIGSLIGLTLLVVENLIRLWLHRKQL